MRRNQTDTEAALWKLLRAKRLEGHKFRRQFPIGLYIVDFACPAAKLIVEADGGQHADNAHDQARDAWLVTQSWRVIRFWNTDILTNPEGVLTALLAALATPLPPTAGAVGPVSGVNSTPCYLGHAGGMADPVTLPHKGGGFEGARHG